MPEPAVATAPIPVHDGISIARLHGLACIDCGAVTKHLHPVGDVLHRGRLWPAVACDTHKLRYMPPPGQATSPLAQGLDQEARFLTHE
ncbi:hypothetical protein ACQEVF_34170 [Nonomuraea polychroma]|uniref:hypothetical protein n=1 Tax=Nonomuraea polychroma TaxID=46176 RepID=UPI003D937106